MFNNAIYLFDFNIRYEFTKIYMRNVFVNYSCRTRNHFSVITLNSFQLLVCSNSLAVVLIQNYSISNVSSFKLNNSCYQLFYWNRNLVLFVFYEIPEQFTLVITLKLHMLTDSG